MHRIGLWALCLIMTLGPIAFAADEAKLRALTSTARTTITGKRRRPF